MKSNYHSHTKWCKHATGDVREIVIEAINQGMKEFAFTEHVAYPNYNSSRPELSELAIIFQQIDDTIKEFGTQIKIYKALECEYVPELHDHYQKLKDQYQLDFLILGHHFSSVPPTMNYFNIRDKNLLDEYERTVIAGINSGLFKMIAHPDVFLNTYPFNEYAAQSAQNILKAIEANNIYLEINANGLRNQCGYPSVDFFKLSKNYQLKYLINADSHALSDLSDMFIKQAYNFANELDIKVEEYMEF